MDQRTIQILFALLRSAICGTKLAKEERNNYSPDLLQDLLEIAAKHDVAHLLAVGLKQNGLIPEGHKDIERHIFNAVYRYEQIKFEYRNLCTALEQAQIPFLPLKGSVIRKYYPEAWMRTSCDIDVLVHRKDLEYAISYLVSKHNYVENGRATHDVSLFTQNGIHVELHFDLVEEGRAQNAINVLLSVWENVTVCENSEYWYEMTDEYLYFYHIAHMAKHFESGGCGIRPFVDLWILDHMKDADLSARDTLLRQGGLLKFANLSRTLCEVWFDGKEADEIALQMQDFLLRGGVYGSIENRVTLQKKNRGGRIGYIISRMFIPLEKLTRYYPVLEKHRWLMPVMQIRRWFMLLKPDVARMAKRELEINRKLDKSDADIMNQFLVNIGLQQDESV